ncbi:type 11 methyltransferase [Candidatus Magnetoovum chiemensis]|nr:type 11 methyltransferase [Candidatus Magnetoovum chiemensis]
MERIGDEPKELTAKWRAETLKGVSGDVLDVGFGIGFNVPYYPKDVISVTALEPSEGMIRRAVQFITDKARPVKFVKNRAETMPFRDNEFDAVVSSAVLCSVGDLSRSLGEIRRVVKPQGRFYFFEHVRADNKKDIGLQNLFNPLNRRVFCGCNLNRDIERAIIEAGFTIVEIERFKPNISGLPKFISYMIRGIGEPNKC